MRITAGLALDTALICLFAAIGRRSHGESGALLAVAITAWPFLTGAGTAFSFIVVATVFLGTALLGWRALATRAIAAYP